VPVLNDDPQTSLHDTEPRRGAVAANSASPLNVSPLRVVLLGVEEYESSAYGIGPLAKLRIQIDSVHDEFLWAELSRRSGDLRNAIEKAVTASSGGQLEIADVHISRGSIDIEVILKVAHMLITAYPGAKQLVQDVIAIAPDVIQACGAFFGALLSGARGLSVGDVAAIAGGAAIAVVIGAPLAVAIAAGAAVFGIRRFFTR